MNDADAASMSRNDIWSRSTPWPSAAPAAMGYMSAAAALLPTTLHRKNVAIYTAMSTPTVPEPVLAAPVTRKSAISPATPDCSIAAEMPKAAAIVVMTSHLTDFLAAFCVRHPVASITPDARSAATKRSRAPTTKTMIMTTAVPHAGSNFSNCGGAEFSISETSANAGSLLYSLRNDDPVSSSSTSPAMRTMSPILAWMRPPERCTAMITASN
mmetsp:Transcript_2689/g.12146  ORF Transcript_2689/g.12146 Transcript_2689/m.12146 type:complete len:213 (-) Transcript_2689:2952-3590(-)